MPAVPFLSHLVATKRGFGHLLVINVRRGCEDVESGWRDR